MKYLLLAVLVFWALTYWAYYTSQHAQADNWAAAIPAVGGAIVSVILTVIYVGLAFWFHQFF